MLGNSADADFTTTTRAGTASDATVRKIPRHAKASSYRKFSGKRVRRRPKMEAPAPAAAAQPEVKREAPVADEKPVPIPVEVRWPWRCLCC